MRATVGLVLLLSGCADPGCRGMLAAELLFGLSRPGGSIDAAAFDDFLDRSVTPRFPAGLTVLDGAGRWRAPDGRLTRERSKLVLIVTDPGPATRAGLEAIRSDYRARFDQQSVGLVLTRVCASF